MAPFPRSIVYRPPAPILQRLPDLFFREVFQRPPGGLRSVDSLDDGDSKPLGKEPLRAAPLDPLLGGVCVGRGQVVPVIQHWHSIPRDAPLATNEVRGFAPPGARPARRAKTPVFFAGGSARHPRSASRPKFFEYFHFPHSNKMLQESTPACRPGATVAPRRAAGRLLDSTGGGIVP